MFAKLKNSFPRPLFIAINDLESWAGIDGKGVHHKRIWSPDYEQLYAVLPKRYWDDFELTVMTINSILLPHQDNDLITTINFYIEPGNYRTIFYKPKSNAEISRPEMQVTGTNVPLEQQIGYVKAVYQTDDVEELDSFIAERDEAYLLDVTNIHNVEPIGETTVRKAIALRTKKYSYNQVYAMLEETGNL